MYTLKQLAESATDLKHKYQFDIFFAARINIYFYVVATGGIIAILAYKFFTYVFFELVHTPTLVTNQLPATQGIDYFSLQSLFILLLLFVGGALCVYAIMKTALSTVAEAITQQKRFISGIAHELRTPLSILRINNELAQLSVLHDSHTLDLLQENILDIDRINEILNTLLQYDRLAKTHSLQFAPVNIQNVLRIATSRLLPFAEQKNITLILTPGIVPDILGNQTALEQACINILKNAITYSPAQTDILITSSILSGWVTMSIKDSGSGIPQLDIKHIFEPFYRSEKTGKLSGMGIGLAVVDQIIRLHYGKIVVTSNEGQGTEFSLCLPVPTTPSFAKK